MNADGGPAARTTRWLKRHGFTALFATTVVILAILIAWWSLFISQTIAAQRQLGYVILSSSISAKAQILRTTDTPPQPGTLKQDNRLEVRQHAEPAGELEVSLAPKWPGLFLGARPEAVKQIEDEYKRKRLMVLGESGTLLIAVLLSSLMLYRSIRLERRSYKELHNFWSRMTHELKTPITGLKAFLQTLDSRDFTREELKPLLQMALREVERQEMLAENLLVGQRLDRHGLGLQMREVNLPEYVKHFIEDHRALLVNAKVAQRMLCPETTQVRVDADALRVVLENLIDNALKYGGPQPDIEIRVEAKPREATIAVRDKGLGFEPAQRERVFEAYQRLSSEQPKGKHGTGMGLYISRQLARKMGGDLRAASAGPRQGATFTIVLRRT